MVRRHGSPSAVSCESTIGLFAAPVVFEPPTACERAAGDLPDALVDGLEADRCPGPGNGDVDPWAVPPEATVGADGAHRDAVGRRERGPCVGHLPGGGCIAGGGGAPREGLVRPRMRARVTAAVPLPLVCAKGGAGRAGGSAFRVRGMRAWRPCGGG